jgi:hypothetical protein
VKKHDGGGGGGVQLMDIIAAWLVDIVFFLSAVLRYILYVSHTLILLC